MGDFQCINGFSTALNAVLSASGTRLPIPTDEAAKICTLLGADPCVGCLPGDEPDTVSAYTRLMVYHNGRFEIVKAVGCDAGVVIIERGDEGTTPLDFPVGTCVQYVHTCGNVADIADAAAFGELDLNFTEGTGVLDLLYPGGVTSTSLSALAGNKFVNSINYTKSSNQVELGFTDSTSLGMITSPYVSAVSYHQPSEMLIVTLKDGTVFNVYIPTIVSIPEDLYLTGVAYSDITGNLTFNVGTVSIPDILTHTQSLATLLGLHLSGVTFNPIDFKVTHDMSDATAYEIDLTPLSTHVSLATFSSLSNNLTLHKNTGGSFDVNLSDLAVDTRTNALTLNPITKVLSLGQTDGTTETADLTPVDTVPTALIYAGTTLYLALSNGTTLTTNIP